MTSLDVLHTPLPALLDYIHAGMGTSHYTLGAGFSAGSIAEMLVAPLKEQGEGYVRLKTTITTMKWECDGSVGVVEIGFEESEAVEVDKVVIATQASAARVLLSKLSTSLEPKEKERVSGMIHALAEVDYRVSQKPTTS
jgi:protoporphyrinogen oxidase